MRRIMSVSLSLALALSIAASTAVTSYAAGDSLNNVVSLMSEGEAQGGSESGETNKPPVLPACNLKDTTYSSNIVSISLSETVGLKLEYALIDIGSSLTDSSWTAIGYNTLSVTNEGSYYFYYRVTDETTGLTTTSNRYTIYLDRTAPSSPTIDWEVNEDDQCVYVGFRTVSDNGSPIEHIYYKIDGNGSWKEYREPFKLTTEGEYEIEAYQVDACGNESSIARRWVEVDYADFLALPKVEANKKSPVNDSITFKLKNYNSNFDYYYKFTTPDSKGGNIEWKKLSRNTSMTISDEGEWDLRILVEYGKDSVTGKVATAVIDKVRPEVYEGDIDVKNNSRYVTISIGAYDQVSGDDLEYSFDAGNTWQSSDSKTFRSEDLMRVGDIQVRDEAGNISYLPYGFTVYKDGNNYRAESNRQYYTQKNIEFDEYARKNGYVAGIGNNLFSPDSHITRAQLATMIYRVVDFKGSPTQTPNYRDVDESHWAYSYIMAVQAYDIIDTSSSKFEPEKEVTRAEMAYAINQILDLEFIDENYNTFRDTAGNKYEDEIVRASAVGIMGGYGDGIFGPNDSLTRAQVVTVFNRLIDMYDTADSNGKTYTDVPVTHWAYENIFKASI